MARAGTALAAIGLIVFGLQVAAVWPFTVDDSFITFRYARNLADGYGPTWNPGEQPTEGYTSFLWVLVTTIPHLLGLDAVLFSKIIGVAATLGVMACVHRLVMEGSRGVPQNVRLLGAGHAVLLLAAFMPSATHAISGMETALYTLLLSALALVVLRAVRVGGGAAWWAAVLALLLGLTRPEGNLAAFVALALGTVLAPRERWWEIAKAALLCYMLPGAIYFVARAAYYDVLLPLPFYMKIASHPISGIAPVKRFSLYLATAIGPLILIGLFGLRRGLFPGVLGAAATVVFFAFPAHIMGYAWRFLYPASPVAIVVAGVGTATAVAFLARLKPGALRTVVIGLVIAASAGLMARQTPELIDSNRSYAAALGRAHVPLGETLAQMPSPEQRVLAIGDAGAVPYLSGWRTIDTFGLNDRVIARSEEYDADYVLDQQPDLLVLISSSRDEFEPHLEWETGLLREARERGYERIGALTYMPGSYYLWLMAQPGSDVARKLSAAGVGNRQ